MTDHGTSAASSEPITDATTKAAALVFIDNAGIARMKCLPVERLALSQRSGIGISSVFGGAQGDDHFAAVPGIDSPTGDIRLVPDMTAAAPLACTPGWLWIPVDQRDQAGNAWPGCQRTFLRRMVGQAADRGIELLCGFELEWTVGREADGQLVPIYTGPGYGAAARGPLSEYIVGVLDNAKAAGIGVEQIHPEYSPGQVEISLSPAEPVTACDQSILVRQIARTVAETMGWRVSFSPLVSRDLIGNGAHAHFSVWHEGRNQFAGGDGPAGLQPRGEHFLAGVLKQLPALTALGAPAIISYQRLQPSHWAGAYACWGHENREAALRLESAVGPSALNSANVEWKSVDMAANPYLVLGGLIAAGLDGIEREVRLPSPVSVDPATLTDAERAHREITRLPESLDAATASFAHSALLREAMGDFLHDCVTYVRHGELAGATDLGEDELYARHRWRY